MNCSICGKPITLVPSATERARMFGGKPSDYDRLFNEHDQCTIKKRNLEITEIIQKLAAK